MTDLWAVGCIYAEMLSLRPIFKAEEAKIDTKKQLPFQRDQMGKICEILGPVKREFTSASLLYYILPQHLFRSSRCDPTFHHHRVGPLPPYTRYLPYSSIRPSLPAYTESQLTNSGPMARNSPYARIQNIPPNRSIPNHKPPTNMVLYPIKFSSRIRFTMSVIRLGPRKANHGERDTATCLVSGGRGC
jgi:hypothetical protein